MKILDIASRLPYPLTDGGRICMFQAVQGLASLGHEVYVVAVDEESTDPGPLADYAQVHVVKVPSRSKAIGALGTLLNPRPYSQAKRDLPEVYRLLERLHAEVGFDVVHADEIHIAQYGAWMKRKFGLPYMLRCHNIETEIYRRHTDTVGNPLLRPYLELQTRRWERFEREQLALADACAAITRRDAEMIQRWVPGAHVRVIPAAVDLDRFPYVPVEKREERSLIILGNMQWPPNRDAAIWFARDIFPLILREVPDVVCYLVGDNPPLAQLPPSSESFRIEGRADSIRAYYDRVTVGLIPLRVGGGMRVKMVEMMGSGLPVVSTTQGAEGNDALPDEHFLLADDPAEFAAKTVRLLRDVAERKRLASAAHEFTMGHYALDQVARNLEGLLNEVIERKGVASR
jgi:glycosyltransferase involved in cell wall biosynthesis